MWRLPFAERAEAADPERAVAEPGVPLAGVAVSRCHSATSTLSAFRSKEREGAEKFASAALPVRWEPAMDASRLEIAIRLPSKRSAADFMATGLVRVASLM